MVTKSTKKGFTIIELMLVILLIGISIGLAISYYRTSQIRADINSQAANIVHYLRLAQSSAVAGLGNSDYGIHFENSSYTTFKGSSYNPTSETNFQIEIPATMTLNNIFLNGGGNEAVFTRPNGETVTYGTVTLSSAEINKSFTITITSSGTINY
ncbi:MAG: type II secretion system protein [Candidatus Gracilibacteria bacterium]|jgi:general secretion pathway protein H